MARRRSARRLLLRGALTDEIEATARGYLDEIDAARGHGRGGGGRVSRSPRSRRPAYASSCASTAASGSLVGVNRVREARRRRSIRHRQTPRSSPTRSRGWGPAGRPRPGALGGGPRCATTRPAAGRPTPCRRTDRLRERGRDDGGDLRRVPVRLGQLPRPGAIGNRAPARRPRTTTRFQRSRAARDGARDGCAGSVTPGPRRPYSPSS